MKERLQLEIELKNELMTTVRLATGGICSVAGLSFEDGEDCKVCVTESLLLLSHRGFESAKITFDYVQGVGVTVEGLDPSDRRSEENDEISFALLSALAEGVSTKKRDGIIYQISFTFREQQ